MSRTDEGIDMGSERYSLSSDDSSMDSIAVVNGQKRDTTAGPIQRKIAKWFTILLPHFGLVSLCIAYLLIGATIFHAIEGPNESIERKKELKTIIGLRNEFNEHIWNITQDENNKISKEALQVINEEYFNRIARAMIRNQYINEKHLLNETNGEDSLWTFSNSIFFATTVLMTIGYGNVMPTTSLGRVACIIFALFGIPLMRVTIEDMGRFLSAFIQYISRVYLAFKEKIRCRIFNRRSKSPSSSDEDDDDDEYITYPHKPVFLILAILLAYAAVGAYLFKFLEDLQYLEAFYSCFMRITTVGFGVNVPTVQMHSFFTMIYIIFGVILATSCIDVAGTEYTYAIQYQFRMLGKTITNCFSRVKHLVYPQE